MPLETLNMNEYQTSIYIHISTKNELYEYFQITSHSAQIVLGTKNLSTELITRKGKTVNTEV